MPRVQNQKVVRIRKGISVIDKANTFAKGIIFVTVMIMFPVVVVNVFTRYISGASLAWSAEVSRYCFVWMTLLGTAIAVRDDSHVKVTYLVDKAPRPIRIILQAVNYLIMIGLALVLIVTGTRQTMFIWNTKAAYMRFLSLGWIYLTIPVCGFLMLLFVFADLLELALSRIEQVDNSTLSAT